MSNIKTNINENSLNSKCITMTDLSNKTNEKDDLISNLNDNKILEGFTKRKRNNSNSKICCYCKEKSNEFIIFHKKEDLIDTINSYSECKGNNNQYEFKFLRFKENKILCEDCLNKIFGSKDYKSKIKRIFFHSRKGRKIKPKIRAKDKQNNINKANLEEINDKSHISSIDTELKPNFLMIIDIKEYENSLLYIQQYLTNVFKVVLMFGENYINFLGDMKNNCSSFFQSYIQTKSILQIMFNTGKIIVSNFKNNSDNVIKCITLIEKNYCTSEISKNNIQNKLNSLVSQTNEILIKLVNFFNNLNVLIGFLNGI